METSIGESSRLAVGSVKETSPLSADTPLPSTQSHPNLRSSGMDEYAGSRFTVLGVGNPIMGDDDLGLQILAELRQLCEQRPSWREAQESGELSFIDGGTGGMQLVPVVQESTRLLILDSVAPGGGRVPGQALHLRGDHVPRLLSMKISPHQVGLLDVLTSSRLTGKEPQVIEVVGVVSADVDLRLGLSAAAAAGMERAVQMAAEVLDSWMG